MRARTAVGSTAFVLLTLGFTTTSATTAAAPTKACPKGSLHTVYRTTHKCLGVALRRQIDTALVQTRDRGVSGARAFAVVAARFRVSVGAVRAVASESARKRWLPPRAPQLPKGVPIRPPDGALFATRLEAEPDCVDGEPGRGVVHLAWQPAAERGTEQRVIATIFRDGFERPAFEASAAIVPGRSTFDWYRLQGQAIHFWKVLTRHGDAWVASEVARFEGPTCPIDSAP